MDEYPPLYFYTSTDPVYQNKEQLVRWLPGAHNQGAGQMWRSFCFKEGLQAHDDEMSLERKGSEDDIISHVDKHGVTTSKSTYDTEVPTREHS